MISFLHLRSVDVAEVCKSIEVKLETVINFIGLNQRHNHQILLGEDEVIPDITFDFLCIRKKLPSIDSMWSITYLIILLSFYSLSIGLYW